MLGKLVERGCLKEVVAVHINHGTRPENNQEAEQVRIFAEKLKIICHIESINLDLEMCNFEAVARLERYKVFKRYLLENDHASPDRSLRRGRRPCAGPSSAVAQARRSQHELQGGSPVRRAQSRLSR